jgi:Rod binding domain-containing protein
MSAISGTSALSSSALSQSGALPLIDPANEPASVRNGDQKAKSAYETGLAFENVFVNELAQQMAATVPGLDGSSTGGSGDDSSSDSSDSSGSGSSGGLGAYSSLLPQTLASSIMSSGGTGIALQIAQSIDPGLGAPKK